MANKWKTATVLLYIISVILMLFSIGLFVGTVARGQLLPNMENIIGMRSADIATLNPGFLTFAFVFLSVVSSLMFSLSVALIMMTRGPFRRNDVEARKIIFTTLGTFLVLAEIISFAHFPNTPWPIWTLCLILAVIAFIKSRPESDTAKK